MRRTELVVLAALFTASVAAAPPAASPTPAATVGEPQLYLSWGAPYGTPGASDAAAAACHDTARVDTLYLTFDPGKDAPAVGGMSGTLYFWPQAPDTLGPFWHLSREGENGGNGLVEFYPPPDGTPSPFAVPGMGAPKYRYNAQAGRLDLIYAVPRHQATPVKGGTRYFFAKMIIRHKRSALAGCGQALCVEWAEAKIALGLGGAARVTTGKRFVSWNARGTAVCKEHMARPAQEFGSPSLPTDAPAGPPEVPLKLGDFKPARDDSAEKK